MPDVLDVLEAHLGATEVPPFLAWKDQTEGIDRFIERAERCPDCLQHAIKFWRLAYARAADTTVATQFSSGDCRWSTAEP
jgi:hypothetical protein